MRTVTIEEITGKVAINVYEGCYDHLCSLNPWGCSAELTAEEVAEGEVVVDDEYDTEGDNRGMAIYVEPTDILVVKECLEELGLKVEVIAGRVGG